MNKLFLLLLGSCFAVSCASTSNISPIFVGRNSNIILDTDQLKSAPAKLTIEDKAVNLLNQLFNTDSSNKNMVLVISNESDCDFTMDISGNNHYTLPVGAKKTESIVVEQGAYEMRSQVCNSYYRVNKTFSENTQLSIKYSVVKNVTPDNTIAGIK
ncbi:DUF6759 domain-containing protein [Epilithonimonas arachidiradicis]|uniref:DUF6759 domain-containing protein n=1 Tax=Epilithonimonas arachidiradicis TaxID=1617282 RepID=A0A420DBC7_9FLAO|nr:DUF6759 domain-containing protein [Epilithonimonas arachidiradicis]RKE88789.1 hypothetical protein BXY58_0913 [Epilithonimonas arachidiradicis]GGG55042.1 hypothetical protein GCM10007332_15850 [Epilithonimonas arachidiradicis]